MTTTPLSLRDESRRTAILNDNLWKVVLRITAPLAIYGLFNYLYGFIDFLLVSFLGSDEVATVFFIEDIKSAITAVGAGIAIGGAVFVARRFGAGDRDGARRYAGQTLSLSAVISLAVAAVAMAAAVPLLHLLNAPQTIIDKGLGFYLAQMASTVIIAINAVYLGIERSKGNTATVMYLNIVAIVIKLTLSTLFVLVFDLGFLSVAISSIVAQGFLMVVGLAFLFGPKNSIAIRPQDLRFDRGTAGEIMKLALPIIGAKFLFSLGRVIVNGLAAVYGTMAIAAFGLASKLVGGVGAVTGAYEETTTSIASQNLGAGKLRRAFSTYAVANVEAVVLGLAGILLVSLAVDRMIPWFTTNSAPEFAALIKAIFEFERFSVVTGATAGIVAGLFIAFKMSRMSLFFNVVRIYVFRIPALLLFLHFGTGSIALGWIMFISNTGTAVVVLILLWFFFRRVRTFGFLEMRY